MDKQNEDILMFDLVQSNLWLFNCVRVSVIFLYL